MSVPPVAPSAGNGKEGQLLGRPLNEAFPSVVLAVQNAAHFIDGYVERMVGVMAESFDHYEIILVDDGSVDGTPERIAAAQKRLPGLILCCFPKSRGTEIAIVAGLDQAIGDFIIVLDPRLDQPELVPLLVERALHGVHIVYALPRDRVDGIGAQNRMINRFLATLARVKEVDMPAALSSCRLVSRAVLNFIQMSADRHRFLIMAPALSGYSYATIIYDRAYPGLRGPRPAAGGWHGFDLMRSSVLRGLSLVFSISVRPLRAVTVLAVATSAISVLYAAYVVLAWLLDEDVAVGWPSLSLQLSGLFFLVSLVLAIMSEYLLQVLESTGRRPLYFFSQQSHSDILAYDWKLNVVDTANEAPPVDAPAGEAGARG